MKGEGEGVSETNWYFISTYNPHAKIHTQRPEDTLKSSSAMLDLLMRVALRIISSGKIIEKNPQC